MNFIKKCWGEIGSDFTKVVMDFFQSTELLRDSNVIWVALAPKFVGAREIKDLWPISMIGCVYKVISKVLVWRMRRKMGFGQRWRGWIKECVCTASMSVLISELPSKSFKMERGLRQGNLLSPFLFVLVVDVLHRMEEETVRNYKWLLRCFEMMTNLSINFDKSSLIPVNCEQEWVQRTCRVLIVSTGTAYKTSFDYVEGIMKD
ncbi:uncharacterized protein LOC107611547 [Arachis ipaensis]|uniref:uncharacterized protein LOC107611547 n=1 Tax=Arachis ipaensis TaxID=130454 RepID=UPI0007AF3ED2|nr:uncharacterized protein LOC107611547 [Arachis ipaensis]